MLLLDYVLFFLTRALQFADVIVLFGARLNWILHFGLPPRYRADVKFIQVLRVEPSDRSLFFLLATVSSAFFSAFIKNLFSFDKNRFLRII